MYPKETTSTGWFNAFVSWLTMHGMLKPRPAARHRRPRLFSDVQGDGAWNQGFRPGDDRELRRRGIEHRARDVAENLLDGESVALHFPPQAVRFEVLEPVADDARARLLDDRVLVEDDALGRVSERVPEPEVGLRRPEAIVQVEGAGGRSCLASNAESE